MDIRNNNVTNVMTRRLVLQGMNAGYALQVQGQELSSECLSVQGDEDMQWD